jgi:hypothetical protein
MRKVFTGTLVGALFLVLAAVAIAANNTVQYTSVTKPSTKPTKAKPANLSYRGILKLDTDPPGSQPDVAPSTTVFFDKAIARRSAKWPSCTKAEIDGKASIPAKCAKARVSVPGKSTAAAWVGPNPGQPKSSQGFGENLDVEAYNGPSGKTIFLVLNSEPSAPVKVQNRVVPGTVLRASGPYGMAVRFDVPADLQQQLGLKVSLTDFDVHISNKPQRVKVGRVFKKVSYLQLVSCPKSRKLAVKAETKFRDTATNQIQARTSVSSSRC